MQCADVQDELVSFHFASCTQDTREALREHLRSCGACAQAYFDLKLDIDSAEAMAEQPSARCHARLRRDVQAWLLPPAPAKLPEPRASRMHGIAQSLLTWLSQPLPRYRAAVGAIAITAVSSLILLQLSRQTQRSQPEPTFTAPSEPTPVRLVPDGTPLGCEFDSARMQAISITYY